MMLTGSLVALVTPMYDDGRVDFESLQRFVEFHIANGTDGLVAVGTTGESATLSVDEHIAVVKATVEYTAGRVPVIAGTGGNSTSEAIELARLAKGAGAQMSLSVVPYYNKPSQEGMYRHFRAIAEAVDLPVILYNVPGRTVADMSNDTVVRLTEVPNIVGLKDATGDIGRACDLIKRVPDNFALYSGDDATGMAFMLCGGNGVISVTANVAPKLMSEMCKAAIGGQAAAARAINDKLQALHNKLFMEPNPIPAKWVLSRMGLMGEGLRLPLTLLTDGSKPVLEAAMKQAGLL